MEPPPAMSAERLAVVIPVYNEEAAAPAVVREWGAALRALGVEFEVLAVDDGSVDGSAAALASCGEPCLRALRQANAGHGAACRAGYGAALESGAAWVLQIDSDGQCDPAYFAALWSRRADCDCVFGRRIRRDDGMVRVLVSAVCSAAASALAGVNAADVNVPYRLMRRDALARALTAIPETFSLQNVALTAALLRIPGLRWAWIPIRFRRRAAGQNSLNMARIARLGLTLPRQWKELDL
jgi:dolichol-phosphate mannosyltransferase